MKIIEAMKKIKDLMRKAEDLRNKVGKYCTDYDKDASIYEDQRGQITSWMDSHNGIIKEILSLRESVQRTNLETKVSIEIDGKHVEHSIAGWIHRRRDLASLELKCWSKLTDEGKQKLIAYNDETGNPNAAKLRLYYNPQVRDEMREVYGSEPSLIDGRLEVVNATTDLV